VIDNWLQHIAKVETSLGNRTLNSKSEIVPMMGV